MLRKERVYNFVKPMVTLLVLLKVAEHLFNFSKHSTYDFYHYGGHLYHV